jgi:hypothetical protein
LIFVGGGMGGMIDGLGRMRYGVGIGVRGIIPGPGGVCMGNGISLVLIFWVGYLGWERMDMDCLGIILCFRSRKVIRIFGMGWGRRGMMRVIRVEICKEWR